MDYTGLANTAAIVTGALLQVPTEIIPFMEYLHTTIKPKSFLELGVCQGATFYIWAVLCEPGGIKLGIDLPNGDWGINHIRSDKEIQNNKHLFQTIAPNSHILFADTHSEEAYKWVVEKMQGGRIDFLFIDADHSENGAKRDYEKYSPFVRKGGVIVFHDIKDTQRHRDIGCDVYKVWQEIEGDKIEFTDPAYDWGGIGVLRV